MSCLKGASKVKKKDARFVCDKCGAFVDKKKQACKAVKVKETKKEKDHKKRNQCRRALMLLAFS